MNTDGANIAGIDASSRAATLEESVSTGGSRRSAEEIQAWLVYYMAELLDVPSSEVDTNLAFDRFGLDSAAAVALTSDLAKWLECDLDPNLTGDYRTIHALSEYLAA